MSSNTTNRTFSELFDAESSEALQAFASDSITSSAATYTVLAANSGKTHIFTSGTGPTVTLPPAVIGLKYTIVGAGTQYLDVKMSGEGQYLTDGGGNLTGYNTGVANSSAYGTITFQCFVTGKWHVTGFSGTWSTDD